MRIGSTRLGFLLEDNPRSIRFRVVRRSNIMVTVVVMGRKGHRKIGNENDCPKILALFGV